MSDPRERPELARELAAVSMPVMAAFVAWWLPVLDYREPADDGVATEVTETSTLIGVAFDSGGSGPTTLIALCSVLAALALGGGALAALAWASRPSARTGRLIDGLAATALLAVLVLWFVVVPSDGEGALGADGLDPRMQLLAWFIAPAWLLVARDRDLAW